MISESFTFMWKYQSWNTEITDFDFAWELLILLKIEALNNPMQENVSFLFCQ